MKSFLAAMCLTSSLSSSINTFNMPIMNIQQKNIQQLDMIEEFKEYNKLLNKYDDIGNEKMKDRYLNIYHEETIEEEEKEPNKKHIGKFLLTAYCNCPICCGQWAYGPCFNGKYPTANYTLAVDPDIIPLESNILIEGLDCINPDNIFRAEDTGNMINDYHIDIYFDNHEEALNFGKKYADIYIIEGDN